MTKVDDKFHICSMCQQPTRRTDKVALRWYMDDTAVMGDMERCQSSSEPAVIDDKWPRLVYWRRWVQVWWSWCGRSVL